MDLLGMAAGSVPPKRARRDRLILPRWSISWTITVTSPSGMTCLVASGQSFETLAEALPPKGKDA